MKVERFEMERMQSTWEHVVDYDMSESGVHPVCMNDLIDMGLDLEKLKSIPIGYSQSNGTIPLREAIAKHYPGASIDHIEVTNGSSEANYLLAKVLAEKGDDVLIELPNYMQLYGVPKSFGANVKTFALDPDNNWEPNWEEFDAAISDNTKFIYVSNPNNPTGTVLSDSAMQRIVDALDKHDVYLISDEVYQGAEISGNMSKSFWGMSDRVFIVSGLSKAYGIPGLRIGWIIGDPKIVAECWEQHDYITIAPNILSDAMAVVAVKPENRLKLYSRTKTIIEDNLKIFREWVDGFDGFFEYDEPKAGAIAFVKYNHSIGSLELANRLRVNKSVLIVPGEHFGMENYLRIALGSPAEKFVPALARIKEEIEKLRSE